MYQDKLERTKDDNANEIPDSRYIQCDNCGKFYPATITADNKFIPIDARKCGRCDKERFTPVVLHDSKLQQLTEMDWENE